MSKKIELGKATWKYSNKCKRCRKKFPTDKKGAEICMNCTREQHKQSIKIRENLKRLKR